MAYSTQYGKSTTKFGAADYAAALYPHRFDTEKLQSARAGVLSWLTGDGASTLDISNVSGKEGGLYERIKTPELSTWWGDHQIEGRKTHFGGADLDASRAAGFSDLQIQSYLDQNPNLLRDDNRPGKGGVYDWITGLAEDNRNPPSTWGDITESNPTIIEQDRLGNTISRDPRNSLTINPGEAMVSKRALGTVERTTGRRAKVRKTKDLNRQTRNLTISNY